MFDMDPKQALLLTMTSMSLVFNYKGYSLFFPGGLLFAYTSYKLLGSAKDWKVGVVTGIAAPLATTALFTCADAILSHIPSMHPALLIGGVLTKAAASYVLHSFAMYAAETYTAHDIGL